MNAETLDQLQNTTGLNHERRMLCIKYRPCKPTCRNILSMCMCVFRRSERFVRIVVVWVVTPCNLDHEDGSIMLPEIVLCD
jgi:hypothetical protein